MTKVIDSLVEASIDSRNFPGVVLARLHFDTIQRFNSSPQAVYWDEDGGGEQQYIGVGRMGDIGAGPETNELSSQSIQLVLSGIPNTAITDAFGDSYLGQPVYIWYATLDKNTYAVEGGQNGPVLYFAGLMDTAQIEFGDTCTITVNATNRLADWERPRGGRFNDSYQRRKVDANDKAFRYVQALRDKDISWGAFSLTDGPRFAPGDSNQNIECFAAFTTFIMRDGTARYVQDIQPGEEMLGGGFVQSVHKAYGLDVECYDYMGDIVSGTHFVYENYEWIMVQDSEYAKPTNSPRELYCVTNVNSLMITDNNIVYNDYSLRHVVDNGSYKDKAIDYLNSRVDLNKELDKLAEL